MISDRNSKPSKEWVLNSACTFHTCTNKDWFSTYEGVSRGAVIIENNAPCKIVGVVTELKCSIGLSKHLQI